MPVKPLFFVVRPESTTRVDSAGHVVKEPRIVPLIPLDNLPEWVEVEGLSRHITFDETVGMINLGMFPAESDKYRLRFLNLQNMEGDDHASSANDSSQGHDHDQDHGHSAKVSGEIVIRPGFLASSTHSCRASSQEGGSTSPEERRADNIVAHGGLASSRDTERSTARSVAGAERLETRRQAKPCLAWCHWGSCSSGNSCSFAHEMPVTYQGLKAVGLSDLPPWWKLTKITASANAKEVGITNNTSNTQNTGKANGSGKANAATSPKWTDRSSKYAAKRRKRKDARAAAQLEKDFDTRERQTQDRDLGLSDPWQRKGEGSRKENDAPGKPSGGTKARKQEEEHLLDV